MNPSLAGTNWFRHGYQRHKAFLLWWDRLEQPVLKRLPALRPWLIHHWFLLANSPFWVLTGLEAFATATVLRSQVYQLTAFVLLACCPAGCSALGCTGLCSGGRPGVSCKVGSALRW